MRKKVIVLVSLLFVLVDMYAQTFYYDTTQVFYAQRYVCDVTQESKSVRLYSKSNKFTEVEAVNKETGAEMTDAERKEANFVDDSQLWGKCLSILNESFSEEERTRVQGCKFIIILRVDTNTGIIRDVEYRFPAVSMLATVPVSVYQEMEIKLKKEIVFNITEKGKRFNYIPFVWAHTVWISLGFMPFYTFFTLIRYSAICTAFNAAPFLIWSPTIQKVSPFSFVRSLRIRPT